MKNNNEETSCEQKSSLTTVSTTYARICVILLALNFCITGYVLTGVLKLQQETSVSSQAQPLTRTASEITVTPPATPTGEIKTLEKED
jgi:uncharacterized protein YpmS